ncbi:MAG: hypothetical protein ACTSV1_09525 [Alphaproteobacteria bacterium]
MIAEWLQHLTTPCPPHLKRLGYLKQLIGLAARHKRCRAAWGPHLGNTREMIVNAADHCSGHGTAVILGSGLLLDVPLQELADKFDEVVLVDILHMPNVRRAVAGRDNVRLEERDITGVVEALSRGEVARPEAVDFGEADLLVSCNILSQLGILPEHVSPGIGAELIRAHLDGLARHSGTVCLITETAHRLVDGETRLDCPDPLQGVAIPDALKIHRRVWNWDFAPHPERHRRLDLIHTVEGFMRNAGT